MFHKNQVLVHYLINAFEEFVVGDWPIKMSASSVPECWISQGLSENTRRKAEVELNETDERRTSALEEFRAKIAEYSESHPEVSMKSYDDAFLVRFLRARKYDTERAFALLIAYNKFRRVHHDMLDGVTLETVIPFLKHKLPFIMKDRDSEGRRVLIFQPARLDSQLFKQAEMQQAILYVLDATIQDPETQVNGFIMVEDYADMTFKKMLTFDQKLMKRMADLVQDAFPARFKGIHMFRQPWYFSVLWNAVKPFIKPKMKERVSATEFHTPRITLQLWVSYPYCCTGRPLI